MKKKKRKKERDNNKLAYLKEIAYNHEQTYTRLAHNLYSSKN